MPYLTETELSNYFQTIDQQAADIDRLTAGSEAMQEDARNNTATINAQTEEIRALKSLLENSRIALTFYREWMFSHAETRYPFGNEIESRVTLKLADTYDKVDEEK